MIERYIGIKPELATHVKIIDEDVKGTALTYGKIYEYLFDAHPSEETHYIICDDGALFYDFECVIEVEYLKKINR